MHDKAGLNTAVIYTALLWLAEDGLLLGIIGIIDSRV